MDVVAEAVRVVAGFAGGAAGAVGAEVGQSVSDLVRRRVGASPSGQAALAVVDERPQDPAALAALTEALRERVAADPEFAAGLAQALAQALAGPPPSEPPPPPGPPTSSEPPREPPESPRQYTGGIVIDGGAKVRGSTLSLGPVTFNNTPGGRTAFVACLAVLAALVVLAVYGGTQAFGGDDSPGGGGVAASGVEAGDAAVGGTGDGSGAGSGEGSGERAGGGDWEPEPLADADAVKQVLPGTTDLASGWTMSSPPSADVSSQDDGSTYEGEAEYLPSYGMDTRFRVLAYPSADKASAAFRARSQEVAEEGARRMTMPAVGDELIAFSLSESRGEGYVTETTNYTMVRTGTVITFVSGKDTESRHYDSGDLQFVTRLMSERARSAQSG
ncbi:hypothetical protein [Streptomyces sp. PA5.6]|uniref:hypothetical protein n=1 Tax=Streptomyces sp. PA5.6 TaxID=3035651 RepID=UPI003904BFEC